MTSFRQQAGEALRTGRVILASSSPRRREILTQLGIAFRVEKPGYDESPVMQELAASYDVPVFQKWLFRSRLKKNLPR